MPTMHKWQTPTCQLRAELFRRGDAVLLCRQLLGYRQRLFHVGMGGCGCRAAFSNHAATRGGRGKELLEKHQPKGYERVTKEDELYWRQLVGAISKPTARALLDKLDLSYPLGAKPPSGKAKRPQLYEYFLATKKSHPRKVLLVRIGEFYETMGTDAVLLVEFAGLNPMGNRNTPMAGCPVSNIRRTLHDLVEEAGLSVVVCEESPEPYRYGTARTKQKKRYIGGIVTPAQPTYLHGLVDEKGDAARLMEAAPPVLGVAASVSGYKMVEVNVDLRSYVVTEGLTEDAVSARLHQGGLAPPLYVHQPVHARAVTQLTDASVETEWALRVSRFFRNQAGSVKYYVEPNPVEGLIAVVKRDLSVDPSVVFTAAAPDPRDRPKALFHSTASQLGIHKTSGIPSLLDAILPTTMPLIQRRYMRRLLLAPPPTEVAANIRTACQLLADLRVPVPSWSVLDCNQVVRMINAQETNEVFFRDLKAALNAAQHALQQPELQPLASEILPAVILETGIHFEVLELAEGCRSAAAAINEVIEAADGFPEPDDTWDGSEYQEGLEVLQRFFRDNEAFRGKVKRQFVRAELEAVEVAGERVERALRDAFVPVEEVGQQHDLQKNRPRVIYDSINNAVWIKLVSGSKSYAKAVELQLVKPLDRNGRGQSKDVMSSSELEDALNEYRSACSAAQAAVRSQLQGLAQKLQPSTPALVGAITFAVIASSLEAHVREATHRMWALPTQLQARQPPVSPEAGARSMPVQGMWPYWLDCRAPKTVRNDIDLASMVILTGPNMAGKSTTMRSLCAVAVLAACGLYAPVTHATVPYTDAFMLRTFSADSPLEGKSSFAIEMTEMRHVMNDVSEDSLVLVDELGKGTEPHAGAAIAATFVEFLDTKGCRGIFATHLHELLDMEGLQFNRVQHMCMETRDVGQAESGQPLNSYPSAEGAHCGATARQLGGKVPTWRIVPGTCRHSLALLVAQQCGVSQEIVDRADELYRGLIAAEAKRRQLTPSEFLSRPQQRPTGTDDTALENGTIDMPHGAQETASDGMPCEASLRKIEEAATLLAETADRVFTSISGKPHGEESSSTAVDSSETADCLAADASGSVWQQDSLNGNGRHLPETQIVRARQAPPPSTVGYSCAYVIRRRDGWFYCGETDDITDRLEKHRRSTGRGGPGMEAAYLVIPSSLPGKSAARELEDKFIKAMQDAGFPLSSVADGRKRRAPRAVSQA